MEIQLYHFDAYLWFILQNQRKNVQKLLESHPVRFFEFWTQNLTNLFTHLAHNELTCVLRIQNIAKRAQRILWHFTLVVTGPLKLAQV
jgi:hypothetical protein